VIRLASRFAISGGRESVVRLLLTALGVALGTALLLLAASADPAIRAHQKRSAWQHTGDRSRVVDGVPAKRLLWPLHDDSVAGEELLVLRVASTGDDAPIPFDLERVPAPGEVFVSPPLARLLDELPPDRLAARFPSRPSGTIPSRFLAGPDELVAVVGVTRASLDGQRDVAAVDRIRTAPEPYQYSDLLRLVLGVGALGLLLPLLVFVATSTRLGAARREQRYAALRLAGATPAQTNVIAGFEAGFAAAVGSVLGGLGFLLVRARFAAIEIDGHPSFPSDLHAPTALLLAILVGVPGLAVLTTTIGLRRLQVSPLGVARRTVRARPTARRLVPLALGAFGFVVALTVARGSSGVGPLVLVLGTFCLMTFGIVAAGPWLTVLIARVIGRFGRTPSSLLAARRLEDDPAGGFRAVSGLVLAVFVASMFSGLSPAIRADNLRGDGDRDADTMVAGVPASTAGDEAETAIDVAQRAGAGAGAVIHEAVDPDRREHPRLVAACRDLVLLVDQATQSCDRAPTTWLADDGARGEPAPYTEAELASLPAAIVAVRTDGTLAATDRIRTALQRALPGAFTFLEAEQAARSNRRLIQLDHLADVALALSLVIAGCGLAVAVAGGIIERKRPFTLLRLSGVHLAELQRIALVEAAAPLLLIAAASATLGLVVSAVILQIAGGMRWHAPDVSYWLSLVLGLGVALAVAASTLPLLGRTTAPSAVRFE
jgi:hypothetical protein